MPKPMSEKKLKMLGQRLGKLRGTVAVPKPRGDDDNPSGTPARVKPGKPAGTAGVMP